MAENKFEPLIRPTSKSTLKDKAVDIKDTMNFERRSVINTVVKELLVPTEIEPQAPTREEEQERRRYSMKTQKMSVDVILRLDILDPFLRSTEEIDHDGKISINDKIDILIESYIKTKLSTRQLEGYQAIYDTYLDT